MTDFAQIVTPRLRLDLLGTETLSALLARDLEAAEQAQGVALPSEFFEELDDFFLRIQLDRIAANPTEHHWCARVMIDSSNGAVIGHCGFHGPPTDVGRAEIGYTVLRAHRGLGYATEAARGLVDFAAERGEKVVFASVSPSNAPSLAVVQKLGFRQTGVQIDDIDGEEWVFELALPARGLER